jgi:hypothetical protein
LEEVMRSRFNVRNFGVLEIIMSVAILAVFSVFLLKLFVSASDCEKKTRLLDRADFTAASYVEQFKSGSGPYDIMTKLGIAQGSGDDRTGTVKSAAEGLTAVVRVTKLGTGDGLYQITVDMRGTNGASVYKLSGLEYFDSKAGDAVG